MNEPAGPRETSIPNDPSRKEPAEGSRENVNIGVGNAQEGAGIANRPIEEEQREQQNLPPRGDNKEGTHA
jgi:hypothetical protein